MTYKSKKLQNNTEVKELDQSRVYFLDLESFGDLFDYSFETTSVKRAFRKVTLLYRGLIGSSFRSFRMQENNGILTW